MRIFGVIGWKNSGKTHLMVRLVSEITARGFSVSTIKHAHHSLRFNTLDGAGRQQVPPGAHEALFASAARWSLVREMPAGAEAPLSALLARLRPVDLVLVEGYKLEGHPKIEAHRQQGHKDIIARNDASIVAVAADWRPPGLAVPVLDLDDTRAIAGFILGHVGLHGAGAERPAAPN